MMLKKESKSQSFNCFSLTHLNSRITSSNNVKHGPLSPIHRNHRRNNNKKSEEKTVQSTLHRISFYCPKIHSNLTLLWIKFYVLLFLWLMTHVNTTRNTRTGHNTLHRNEWMNKGRMKCMNEWLNDRGEDQGLEHNRRELCNTNYRRTDIQG